MRSFLKNILRHTSLFFLVVFSIFLGFLNVEGINASVGGGPQAPSTVKLYGTAWSDNIGWISFSNCEVEQDGSLDCGPVQYGVEVGNTSGNITGGAWSDNIGWIQFDGSFSFPSGAGTVSNNAKINFLNGAVTGWARACAGTTSGDCSTMNSQIDGWDGWISLSGDYHTSPQLDGTGGVTFDSENSKLIGKAWGGDVVGWIDFVDVRYGPIPPDLGEFVYSLSNSTESSSLEIEQGSNSSASITRTWDSGPDGEVTLSVPSDLDNGNITLEVSTNNPCVIGSGQNTCSSTITISVGSSATVGDYVFDVEGTNDIDSETETTQVSFGVTEADPPVSEFTCSAEGNPWLYQTITWEVFVDEITGLEDYYWQQDNEDLSYCSGSSTCEISYTTVGAKTAEISINGSDGTFEQCDTKNIGARVFFREI